MKTLRLFAYALVIALVLVAMLPNILPGPEETGGGDRDLVVLEGSLLEEPAAPATEEAAASVPAETVPLPEPAVAEPAVAALPEPQPEPEPEPEALPAPDAPEIALAPAEAEVVSEPQAAPSGALTRAEIAAAPPSGLSPRGFLSDVYSFERADEISDEQREAVTRGIVGKMVEWELTLFNTSEGDDGEVILMSAGADQAEVFCKIPETSDEEIAEIRRLAPGDRFTCKGRIAGTFIRNLVIEPAILMTGQPGL